MAQQIVDSTDTLNVGRVKINDNFTELYADSSEWGNITGTLSDQTDLQTALDGKVNDTGNETIAGIKTFTDDPLIPDEAYGAGWNGSLEPPTKNAVYDKIETMTALSAWLLASGGTLTGTNTIYAGSHPLIFNTSVTTQTDQSSGIRINANTLTTGHAFAIESSSVTSGTVHVVRNTSTAVTTVSQAALVETTGTNANSGVTSTALRVLNNRTGTTSTNVGLSVYAHGATANYAIYAYGPVRIESATAATGIQISGGAISNYGGVNVSLTVTGGNTSISGNQFVTFVSSGGYTCTLGNSVVTHAAPLNLTTITGGFFQSTTGTWAAMLFSNSHTSTTGTPAAYNYASIRISGTFNITSPAGGYIAGFYFNPTITASNLPLYSIASLLGSRAGFSTLTPTATVHAVQAAAGLTVLKTEATAVAGLTAATEYHACSFLGEAWTWADGTVTTQRFNYFQGYTLNKTTTAATFTNAYNVYIDDLTAGSGVTITNKWSLGVVGNVIIAGTRVNIANLPTSAAGLATGDLWNDSNTIKIA